MNHKLILFRSELINIGGIASFFDKWFIIARCKSPNSFMFRSSKDLHSAFHGFRDELEPPRTSGRPKDDAKTGTRSSWWRGRSRTSDVPRTLIKTQSLDKCRAWCWSFSGSIYADSHVKLPIPCQIFRQNLSIFRLTGTFYPIRRRFDLWKICLNIFRS